MANVDLSTRNSGPEDLVSDISLILSLSVLDSYLSSFSHNRVRSYSYNKSLFPQYLVVLLPRLNPDLGTVAGKGLNPYYGAVF